jgi:dihydrofolate synthase/folylpolyglutamate synthase
MPAEASGHRGGGVEQGATLIPTDADSIWRRGSPRCRRAAGEHQGNAGVALRLLEAVGRAAPVLHVDDEAIRAGLTRAVWPGRLETFTRGDCRVLLDAAHNPAGARALASYLRTAAPDGVTLVFAAMQDKAVLEMLTALTPVVRAVVCATAPNPRAMGADALAALASDLGLDTVAVADPVEAVTHACGTGRLVVVAGSIFLIGPVREWLARDILR